MTRLIAVLNWHVFVWEEDGVIRFENDRGMMINGNRRIHMANWESKDLIAIGKWLEAMQAMQPQIRPHL